MERRGTVCLSHSGLFAAARNVKHQRPALSPFGSCRYAWRYALSGEERVTGTRCVHQPARLGIIIACHTKHATTSHGFPMGFPVQVSGPSCNSVSLLRRASRAALTEACAKKKKKYWRCLLESSPLVSGTNDGGKIGRSKRSGSIRGRRLHVACMMRLPLCPASIHASVRRVLVA